MLRRSALALLILLSAPLVRSPAEAAEIRAVASFSILADFVREVGGTRVEVAALVGPNGDAHEFEPSPADAKLLGAATVIVTNGLGLEGWFDRLVRASGSKAPVIVASERVAPQPSGDRREGAGGKARPDPHAWQSVANAKLYVETIRDGLVRIDPAGSEAYKANASRYLAALDRLEAEVKAAMATIPAGRREIVTTHDAFGYFGKAYGMTFTAPQGVSTESEASARDVAKIIRQIKAGKIPAVFIENISDPRLMERIARESGARIGAKLYSDSLSESGGPAATYLDMMRNNARAFAAALGT